MPKATNDPTTGDRAVAPEILAAGRSPSKPPPGLTSAGDQAITEAATENGPRGESASGDISPETAAAAVALTATSILSLGKQLAAVEIAHEAFDSMNMRHSLKAGDVEAKRRSEQRSKAAWTVLEDRSEALRQMISSMPAVTIADVAVQIGVMCTAAGRLSATIHTQQQVEAIADRIERMALGILPIVAKAAGLDFEAMDWLDHEHLRINRFDGVGVTS